MKTLLLLLAGAGLAVAQSQPPSATQTPGCIGPECPDNLWPNDPQGFDWQTGDTVITQFCVYIKDDSGHNVGIPGIVGHIYTYTTQLTGDHSHEISLNTGRPQGKIPFTFDPVPGYGPTTAISDSSGCANWVTTFPDFAGYVTWEVEYDPFPFEIEPGVFVPVQFPPEGINNFIGFYSENEFGEFEALVEYPDNQTINAPQSLAVDQNHNHGTMWFQQPVVTALTAASTRYVSDSSANTDVRDRASIFRGSLEYGGSADNYSFPYPLVGFMSGFAPWQEEKNELHQQGIEVDLINPSYNQSDFNPTSLLFGVLVRDLNNQGCYLGTRLPGSSVTLNSLDRRNYWLTQQYFHVSCGALVSQ